MKHLTITLIILALSATACKKDKDSGQKKCVWNVIFNNQVAYEWLEKPSDLQVKLITDSCSCAVKVNEVCFSCNTTVTTASGIDVQCK